MRNRLKQVKVQKNDSLSKKKVGLIFKMEIKEVICKSHRPIFYSQHRVRTGTSLPSVLLLTTSCK